MTGDPPQTDYRKTLNLPTTGFPMRGDLPKREPERVRWWAEHDVYRRRLERNAKNQKWILHDGPPYANGEPHMGSFLNRVLKDVFVKVHLLDGRYAYFVPGWDMHGLPIEFETLKHLKLDFRRADPIELRAKCREHALQWLDVQRDAFLRMGTFGDFAHPYRTIDAGFEATVVEMLADLAEQGQLYKGLRSTLWCVHDETALAEAEIEYKERVSPSIYVRFPAEGGQRDELLRIGGVDDRSARRLSALIWTTTPWTLPANEAIALKPDAPYGIYEAGDELLLLADALATSVPACAPARRLGGAAGSAFVGTFVRHPFAERDAMLVGADYVSLDTGTGLVHTAPGHGADDFDTGVKFGLPILVPVDARGTFTVEAGPYAGLNIFAANPQIVAGLRERGALFFESELRHAYPHCWRCKNPVIFRATSQWFIALDVNRLRKRVQERIPEVRWHPPWGESRMFQTIAGHPEWCISRQRAWGTPIPAVRCTACDGAVLDPALARNVARLFRERASEEGNASDAWWTEPLERFLPANFTCATCGGGAFEKEFNIVDIWFESGCTHRAVLKSREGLHWPADLYLEGSDQYRGWFRSNLVTAVATAGAPPTKAVVSAGWVVDAQGHAMHKSAGNYVGAQAAMNSYGADVLRLWTAAVEFTADTRFGDEIVASVGSVYRNLRYRLRMLLGLIFGLGPSDVVPRENLRPLDRLALARLDDFAHGVVRAYGEYRLHDVYLALVEYDDELSAFYVEALKEPLYTGPPNGPRRRSGQSTALEILRALCALEAPILSFTAEEAWQHVPKHLRDGAESVFDLALPHGSARGAHESAELHLWETLKSMRAVVASAETLRDFQMQAHVRAPQTLYARLAALGDGLREALVVSAVRLEADPLLAEDAQPLVELMPAEGDKCVRCWKTLPLGADPAHPQLCAPCAVTVNALAASA